MAKIVRAKIEDTKIDLTSSISKPKQISKRLDKKVKKEYNPSRKKDRKGNRIKRREAKQAEAKQAEKAKIYNESKKAEEIRKRRSEASKRGWETRRKKQAEAESLKQRRSEASKRGWETRRKKQAEAESLDSKENDKTGRVFDTESTEPTQQDQIEDTTRTWKYSEVSTWEGARDENICPDYGPMYAIFDTDLGDWNVTITYEMATTKEGTQWEWFRKHMNE